MKDAAEMPGQWHGLGTKLLGLKGEVKREDYFSLCDNQHPETGQSLTRNTRADRRVLYDFTFDARSRSASPTKWVGMNGF